MKKILLVLSLLLVFACTSCDGAKKYLSTGNYELQYVTYYGKRDEPGIPINYPEELKVFSKLKYELKRITEEEYEQANGQNVFIDFYSNNKSAEKIYLYLEVYLYYAESNRCEKIECKNIEIAHGGQNPYVYLGECIFKINNVDYIGLIELCFSTYKSGSGTQEIGIIFNEKEYVMNFTEIKE